MAEETRKTLLDVRDLAVAFDSEGGAVHAVNGVSYTLAEGLPLGEGVGHAVHRVDRTTLAVEGDGEVADRKSVV